METTTAQEIDAHVLVLIEEHVRRLLGSMNFTDAKVVCALTKEPVTLSIAIDAGEEGRMLIGAGGSHLMALQHVIRCVLRSELQQPVYIAVDVNGYRERREQSLLGLAQETARKAQRTGRTIVLQPMSASDRRAIHSALANQKDIRTESLGDEPNRRVVVRPVFL